MAATSFAQADLGTLRVSNKKASLPCFTVLAMTVTLPPHVLVNVPFRRSRWGANPSARTIAVVSPE
ncbi:hypothetical protein [Stenotrophomonas sp. 24(2023)]|uniref:hypothetical protein n=1 Tax=Stenotrophomonas sp. 24(2023) TaxID=3068324 RepID=UPI0027E08FC7|nr:hypothetical protein [Stenotrophomonas sp. 24(2023)]WMJ68818.1 hypothetical protein Q9R17_16775 [Stenotrophomonas sp. 24(2023)]